MLSRAARRVRWRAACSGCSTRSRTRRTLTLMPRTRARCDESNRSRQKQAAPMPPHATLAPIQLGCRPGADHRANAPPSWPLIRLRMSSCAGFLSSPTSSYTSPCCCCATCARATSGRRSTHASASSPRRMAIEQVSLARSLASTRRLSPPVHLS